MFKKKFRVWDISCQEYMKEKRCKFESFENDVLIYESKYNSVTLDWAIENDQDFICEQFSGVLGKNGVEIYEGDIVKQRTYNGFKNEIVKFEDGCFFAGFHTGSSTKTSKKIVAKNLEVVGNIHFDQ